MFRPTRHFQVGVAEKLLHQHLGFDGAGSGFQNDAHVGRRFVADVGEQRQLAEREQLRRFLNQARLLDVIGNFVHHDLVLTMFQPLDLPPGAQAKSAAARPVGIDDGRLGLNQDAAGGKIGPGNKVDQFVEGRLGALDQVPQRIAQFTHIMGRDAGRHADGDADGAVGQQIGKTSR